MSGIADAAHPLPVAEKGHRPLSSRIGGGTLLAALGKDTFYLLDVKTSFKTVIVCGHQANVII